MGLSVAAGGVLVACGCEPGALKTSLVVLLALWDLRMSFTWPALEAMATEGESGGALQQMVGIYNLVWAAASAAAYFCGGALVQTLGVVDVVLDSRRNQRGASLRRGMAGAQSGPAGGRALRTGAR